MTTLSCPVASVRRLLILRISSCLEPRRVARVWAYRCVVPPSRTTARMPATIPPQRQPRARTAQETAFYAESAEPFEARNDLAAKSLWPRTREQTTSPAELAQRHERWLSFSLATRTGSWLRPLETEVDLIISTLQRGLKMRCSLVVFMARQNRRKGGGTPGASYLTSSIFTPSGFANSVGSNGSCS
jgi:hypothetical protein